MGINSHESSVGQHPPIDTLFNSTLGMFFKRGFPLHFFEDTRLD